MNTGRFFVLTMTVLGVFFAGCSRTTEKAVKEGNERQAASDKMAKDLLDHYGINVDPLVREIMPAAAEHYQWPPSAEKRKEIREALTRFIANATALLQIEHRSDVKVTGDSDQTNRRRNFAALYLKSLDAYEAAAANAPTAQEATRPSKKTTHKSAKANSRGAA